MNKIRKYFMEAKEGFLDAKYEGMMPAFILANKIVIYIIFITVYFIGILIYALNFKFIGIAISILALIYIVATLISDEVNSYTIPLSLSILLYFFGKYGRVVTKKDWQKIKHHSRKEYRKLTSKKSRGYCFYFSRLLALNIEDAKLMYCSQVLEDRKKSAHSVIIKNNCVYDTNKRMHFDYDEYLKMDEIDIYKIFSYEEYSKQTFFDDIRDDFKKWCEKRNVYCDPQ